MEGVGPCPNLIGCPGWWRSGWCSGGPGSICIAPPPMPHGSIRWNASSASLARKPCDAPSIRIAAAAVGAVAEALPVDVSFGALLLPPCGSRICLAQALARLRWGRGAIHPEMVVAQQWVDVLPAQQRLQKEGQHLLVQPGLFQRSPREGGFIPQVMLPPWRACRPCGGVQGG